MTAPVPEDRATLFSEVFVTAELTARPSVKTDWVEARLAVQNLALRMAEDPAQVLPLFVELAMQLTGGISAGLSLLEPEPSPGVFYWRHLCGTLAKFEGARTPRDDSPCGITLDERTPVLTRYSERLYKWIADKNVVLPEVLLVPLFLGGPEPLGTLWIVSDTEGHFDSGHARLTAELANFVGIALRLQRNKGRARAAIKAQENLETHHRATNGSRAADSGDPSSP